MVQGAEAVISKEGNEIVKERIPKSYRHPLLDQKLRQFRTKREATVLKKLQIAAPQLIAQDKTTLRMSYVEGKQLKELLDTQPVIAKEVGLLLAQLHDQNIIHGDVTTSNMIYDQQSKKLFFIDFGLSYFSQKIEDKAVDIHLLKQALESKHHTVWEKAYQYFLKGYAQSAHAEEVLARLQVVESRGRYKERF